MWINLEHELLLNLDHIISVYANNVEHKEIIDYVIDYFEPGDRRPFRESFPSQEKRDEKYQWVKQVLLSKGNQ